MGEDEECGHKVLEAILFVAGADGTVAALHSRTVGRLRRELLRLPVLGRRAPPLHYHASWHRG
jgi:hypothetical protein